MTAHLQLVSPSNENRTVRTLRQIPKRPANRELRPREYLTPAEVETLIRTARKGRHGHRDAPLILVSYRHGLRATELCDLEWSQVEFSRSASLHVRRAKNGKPSVHPLRRDEIRALVSFSGNSRTRATSSRPSAVAHSRRMPPIG